jgi:hypothetical protein
LGGNDAALAAIGKQAAQKLTIFVKRFFRRRSRDVPLTD